MARNGPRPGDYLPGPGAKRKNQGGWALVFVTQRPLVLEPKWPRVRYTYHYPEDVVTRRHPMLVMDCETQTRYAPVRSTQPRHHTTNHHAVHAVYCAFLLEVWQ